MSKQPNSDSLCSKGLMYFVNEYQKELPENVCVGDTLDSFVLKCIASPLEELYLKVESPTFAHEIQKMIDMYNWYITNRFWAYQLLYPVVSFLRVYYSIILHSSDIVLYRKMLYAYVESLSGEVI